MASTGRIHIDPLPQPGNTFDFFVNNSILHRGLSASGKPDLLSCMSHLNYSWNDTLPPQSPTNQFVNVCREHISTED